MDTTIQSTFRPLSTLTTLCCVCFVFGACSKQNDGDWFSFGKKTAPVQVIDEDPSPSLTTAPPVPKPVETLPASPQPDIQPNAEDDSPIEPSDPNVEEIVHLYRRLHVEMDQSTRSQLIVELLNDSRERVRLLGFDLASRDLSAGATLSDEAANAAVSLLSDQLPSIRTSSARLITRLALSDAMTLLTNALSSELDPTVAESLLRGIERWPSPQARDDVLKWYQSSGPVRAAAANAAWGLADLNLWENEADTSVLRIVYRTLPDSELLNADRRLIAVTGTNSDIDRLILLARDSNNPTRINAANALIYTPRGVDPLIDLASIDPVFTPAAAASIENHRLNPEGIHRLAALRWADDQDRIESLVNACARLDHTQLSDAIRLARADNSIDDELSIHLLNPLIAGPQIVSTRTAPGVILLAELELTNQRPDRTIEILSLLPETGVDPASTLRVTHIKAMAHILLSEFELAARLTLDPETWMGTLTDFDNLTMHQEIAQQIQNRSIDLSVDQRAIVEAILSALPPTPDVGQSYPEE